MLQLTEEQLKPYYRVCSQHFPNADPKKKPNVWLGKRFASPVKRDAPRTKRAKMRQQSKTLEDNLAVPLLLPLHCFLPQHHHLPFHTFHLHHSLPCLEEQMADDSQVLSYLMPTVTQLPRQDQRLPLIGQQYQAAKKLSVQDSNCILKLCRQRTTS